jgi:hypothetical protein
MPVTLRSARQSPSRGMDASPPVTLTGNGCSILISSPATLAGKRCCLRSGPPSERWASDHTPLVPVVGALCSAQCRPIHLGLVLPRDRTWGGCDLGSAGFWDGDYGWGVRVRRHLAHVGGALYDEQWFLFTKRQMA